MSGLDQPGFGRADNLADVTASTTLGTHLDIGNLEVLVDCARRAGLDEQLAQKYLQSDEGRQEVVASDVYARRLGINGVPCFIVNRKYAVSGAQPPSAFVEVFNLAERDAATATAQSTV